MPKKRYTRAEALEAVTSRITAAGGKISYRALMEQLESDGQSEVLLFIPNFGRVGGEIQGELVYDGVSKPELHFIYPAKWGNN